MWVRQAGVCENLEAVRRCPSPFCLSCFGFPSIPLPHFATATTDIIADGATPLILYGGVAAAHTRSMRPLTPRIADSPDTCIIAEDPACMHATPIPLPPQPPVVRTHALFETMGRRRNVATPQSFPPHHRLKPRVRPGAPGCAQPLCDGFLGFVVSVRAPPP